MLARKPRMLVTVALANKMAHTVSALLVKQEDYRAPVPATALATAGQRRRRAQSVEGEYGTTVGETGRKNQGFVPL